MSVFLKNWSEIYPSGSWSNFLWGKFCQVWVGILLAFWNDCKYYGYALNSIFFLRTLLLEDVVSPRDGHFLCLEAWVKPILVVVYSIKYTMRMHENRMCWVLLLFDFFKSVSFAIYFLVFMTFLICICQMWLLYHCLNWLWLICWPYFLFPFFCTYRYNESDQPVCRVCDVVLKSVSHWDAHQASRKHHEVMFCFPCEWHLEP